MTGETVDKRSYLTYGVMRGIVRKFLLREGHIMQSWYEFKIDKNGFRKINTWERYNPNGNCANPTIDK